MLSVDSKTHCCSLCPEYLLALAYWMRLFDKCIGLVYCESLMGSVAKRASHGKTNVAESPFGVGQN